VNTIAASASVRGRLRVSRQSVMLAPRPFFMPLFIQVPRRGILGTLHTASCVERHLKTVRLDP